MGHRIINAVSIKYRHKRTATADAGTEITTTYIQQHNHCQDLVAVHHESVPLLLLQGGVTTVE